MIVCDVVLTVYNNLELTQKCIDSIIDHTSIKTNLIIVDNGSDDETRIYLEGLNEKSNHVSLTRLRLEPNQGFIKAANAGLKESKSECVCLISNDTVVTAGWLRRMYNLLEANATIGIVGPTSNAYGVQPKNGQSIDACAAELETNRGHYKEVSYCIGFCMLIHRRVIETIGYLDEAYGAGYFEDNDYSKNAISKGFLCVMACDAYVWHKEHATFSSGEREEQFRKNRELYHARWGVPQRIVCMLRKGLQNDETRQKVSGACVSLAREGHWLWVVLPRRYKRETLLLEQHTTIKRIYTLSCLLYLVGAFWVIKKRKKKIDYIYIDEVYPQWIIKIVSCILRRPIKELSYG